MAVRSRRRISVLGRSATVGIGPKANLSAANGTARGNSSRSKQSRESNVSGEIQIRRHRSVYCSPSLSTPSSDLSFSS